MQFHESVVPRQYLFRLCMLTLMEIPLATAPMTLYLGHALFMKKPSAKQLVKQFFASLPQLVVFQILFRVPMICLFVTWLLLFGVWPYMNEVILLERNPLFRKRPGQMTTFRRIRSLHGGVAGDLVPRWFASVFFGTALFASLWLSCLALCGLLLNEWGWDGPTFSFFFPFCLWITIGFLAVVRYLSYLDLRIRREGWEVELLMRAEGAKLTRQHL
jgi:hypothetical protein